MKSLPVETIQTQSKDRPCKIKMVCQETLKVLPNPLIMFFLVLTLIRKVVFLLKMSKI